MWICLSLSYSDVEISPYCQYKLNADCISNLCSVTVGQVSIFSFTYMYCMYIHTHRQSGNFNQSTHFYQSSLYVVYIFSRHAFHFSCWNLLSLDEKCQGELDPSSTCCVRPAWCCLKWQQYTMVGSYIQVCLLTVCLNWFAVVFVVFLLP